MHFPNWLVSWNKSCFAFAVGLYLFRVLIKDTGASFMEVFLV